MKKWQRNVATGTIFALTTLFIGFVFGGVLPNVVPFLPLMLIAMLAISSIRLDSIGVDNLHKYLSTNK